MNTLLVIGMLVGVVRAELSPAPGDFGWRKSIPLHLIAEDAVVADLDLSPEVTEKLRDLQLRIQAEVLADIQRTLRSSFREESLRFVEEYGPAWGPRDDVWSAACATLYRIRNTHRAAITDLLTTRQLARLDEIHLQKRNRHDVDGLGDSNVAQELKLTPEQRARIQTIFESTRKLESPKSRSHSREGYAARARNVLNVLTEEQRAAFTQLLGEPLKSGSREVGK
jgi:Spy/CpxP family protein refolding chaperone